MGNFVEKYLKRTTIGKSVLYNKTLVDSINLALDKADRIGFALEEIDTVVVSEVPLSQHIDTKKYLEDYQTLDNLDFKLLQEYPFKRIEVFELPKSKNFQTFNLENYNKLSDKVDPLLKNYVFEVVDYFKRNQVTNFTGKITFVKIGSEYKVFDILVKEIVRED